MKFAQSLFRFVTGGARRGLPLGAVGLLALVLLTGCDPQARIDLPETDEPQYRRGQQYLRSQQNQHALEAFLKVIDKRDGDAPESHFEAGRIYLTHLGDPYAAIYHFRRYLQIRPNSQQAPMVKQMIETAMKESLKGLPGNAMSAEVDRLDLLDMIERLKAENADLRTRLDRAGVAVSTPPTLPPTQGQNTAANRSGQTAGQPPAQSRNPGPQPATQVARGAAQTPARDLESLPADDLPVQPPVPVDAPAPQQAVRQQPQRPAATQPATSGRTYVVQPKDSLMGISRKIYGTPARWRDIFEANRDRMKHESDLKIGMELRLP